MIFDKTIDFMKVLISKIFMKSYENYKTYD
jgi:hypothetical protein